MSNTLKKSIHLTIALVCSITLFLAGAFVVPKPVAIKAEIPDSFQKVSFALVNIPDGTYSYENGVKYAAAGEFIESFDQKCFSGTINFSGDAKLYIAGSETGKGLSISPYTSGSTKALAVYWGSTRITYLTPANVGMTSLHDVDLDFAVTFAVEDLDSDGSKDDITFGFYFGGNLYRNQTYKQLNAVSDFGKTVSIECFTGASLKVANDNAAGAIIDKRLNWISNQHFYVADGTYGYNDGIVATSGSYFIGTKNSYFSTNVKFSAEEGAILNYAGLKKDNGLGGFGFKLQNGDLVLSENLSGNNYVWTFKAADAGLESFAETTFKLGVTIKAVDHQKDGRTNDIELGVWFGDVLYKNEYIYLSDQLSKLGDTLGIYSPVEGSTVTVGVVSGLEINMPDYSLDRFTFGQLGIADGTYEGKHPKHTLKANYTKGFDNTYFSGTFKFQGDSRFYWGAIGEGWVATAFRRSGNNIVLYNTDGGPQLAQFTPQKAGVASFGEEFRLGISTEFVDKDGDGEKNDLKLGVYFNEKLYDGKYIFILNRLEKFGKTACIYGMSGSSLTVGTLKQLLPPPEEMPEGLRLISLGSFSISDNTYKYKNNDLVFNKTYNKDSLGNTHLIFNAKISNPDNKEISFRYGATGWGGIQITFLKRQIRLHHTDNPDKTTITLSAENTSVENLLDQTYKIGLTTQFVDLDGDGEEDDVRFGVWIEDVLCGNKYLELVDYASKLKKNLALYIAGPNGTVELERIKVPAQAIPEDQREKFPEGLQKITISDFALAAGTYEGNFNSKGLADLAFKKVYSRKSLENIYFVFNTQFNKVDDNKELSLRYAGAGDGWSGVQITISKYNIRLHHTNDPAKTTKHVNAEDVGLESFTGLKYQMGFTTQFIDLDDDGEKDDVRFGVWVNDILCSNKYLDLIDYAPKFGKTLALYVSGKEDTVEFEKVEVPPYVIPDDKRPNLPENLTLITLNDFTINDAVVKYRNNDLCLSARYDKSLDNTYCEFYVTPSSTSKEMTIRYGGGGWSGLAIKFNNSKIEAYDASGRSSRFSLSASDSKMTSFTNQTYLLGISTQYMDLDNDGEKDDVRFGIWANGVLCGNEYVDIKDYVQYMGKSFAVYIADKEATLGLKSIMIPIDFEMFGFTKNWAAELITYSGGVSTSSGANTNNGADVPQKSPQTGDTLVKPMLFSCVALGGLMDTDKTHRRKLNVR